MATRCLIKFGNVRNGMGFHDDWVTTETLYKHWDGYPKNIRPILKECKGDKNELLKLDLESPFEEVELEFEDIGTQLGADYIYYIDRSNCGNIKCTVVENDLEFSKKYSLISWTVVKELIL